MTQRYQVDGIYTQAKGGYTDGTYTFIKGQRTKPTSKKAPEFLIFSTPDSTKPEYFSSLYPIPGGYTAEYQGSQYIVTFIGADMVIESAK